MNHLSHYSHADKVTASCRGSLNVGASVYSVVCDSDRDLQYRCFIDGQEVTCEFLVLANHKGLFGMIKD